MHQSTMRSMRSTGLLITGILQEILSLVRSNQDASKYNEKYEKYWPTHYGYITRNIKSVRSDQDASKYNEKYEKYWPTHYGYITRNIKSR
ncbi:hypothetical protein TNCT_545481 [Trichonephila clavata]|uniref:Uncharacterized protein n=1 Tax=Trichonephila clavata TaxID=2740835 RepID=A0A8X6JV64_TRICU|nr:hypothetical protein TNCT_545481 [Trichonephila clavata]